MPDCSIERWIVSKSALVSWRGGRIEITSPLSGATFETDNPDVLHVLHAFASARPIEEVVRMPRRYPPEKIATCIYELIEAGLLTRASEADPMTAHYWELSALSFHSKSRHPGLPATRSHNTAPVATPRSHNALLLDRPESGQERDFVDVLESRHSWRSWPKRTIARKTFSNLLWMSARNRDLAGAGVDDGCVNRPYPSGGSAYSLELYPVIAPRAVESIVAGVYRYLPESHGLELLSTAATHYLPFLEAAGRSASAEPPPVVLVVTSRFARQGEVYGDLAYSLVLKEVGALFQTLYLVAEYLELAPCALGGGTPDDLHSSLCETTHVAEPVVGEFIVGPR